MEKRSDEGWPESMISAEGGSMKGIYKGSGGDNTFGIAPTPQWIKRKKEKQSSLSFWQQSMRSHSIKY